MSSAFEWGSELPLLEADRLTLRPVMASDAAAVLGVFGDAEVMKYWSSAPQQDLAAATRYINEIQELYKSRQLFQWGVASVGSDTLFGTCTLFQLDRTQRRAEIGFVIGRSAWGQGLATEAVETLLGFAFSKLDLRRVEADVDPHNTRSLHLLERQGFQHEGLLRERWNVGDELQDSVILGLLRHEWRRPKEGPR